MFTEPRGVTGKRYVGLRATATPLFDTGRNDYGPDANRGTGDWLVFYTTNPWGLPQTQQLPSYGEMNDDEWVGRSSAALREWMEENPF